MKRRMTTPERYAAATLAIVAAAGIALTLLRSPDPDLPAPETAPAVNVEAVQPGKTADTPDSAATPPRKHRKHPKKQPKAQRPAVERDPRSQDVSPSSH